MRFCCTVVLYEPNLEMLQNINQLGKNVEKVFIMDNSSSSHSDFLKNNMKYLYEYQYWGCNKGLAYALNDACSKAAAENFDYIFTMDQDSIFEETSMDKMKEFVMFHNQHGMLAPQIIPYFKHIPDIHLKEKADFEIVKFAITSGCLMNIKAFQDVGGFDSKLFIEHIDVDYCIKLYQNSWSLLRMNHAILYQRAGNSIPKKLFGRVVHPLFASPVRGYYLFRNQKYIKQKYGNLIYGFTGKLYKTLIKTILYEDKKLIRILFYIKGYLAALNHQMGEIKE